MKYTQEQIDEYRAKWLAQLRSPEAKKTCSKLEDPEKPNHRCCLGHACYVLGLTRTVEEIQDDIFNYDAVYYDNGYSYLPISACEMLDINPDGDFKEVINVTMNQKQFCKNLAELNDDTELQPAEIADIIEENFKANNFTPHTLLDINGNPKEYE